MACLLLNMGCITVLHFCRLEGSRELRESLAKNEVQRFFQAMHHQRIPEAAFCSARMREVLQMRVQATSN